MRLYVDIKKYLHNKKKYEKIIYIYICTKNPDFSWTPSESVPKQAGSGLLVFFFFIVFFCLAHKKYFRIAYGSVFC